METYLTISMHLVLTNILKAGWRITIYNVLIDHTFINHLFKLSINCGPANLFTFFIEEITYIINCNMTSFFVLRYSSKTSLLCFICHINPPINILSLYLSNFMHKK